MNTFVETEEEIVLFRVISYLYLQPQIDKVRIRGPYSNVAREKDQLVYETPRRLRIFIPNNRYLSFIFQKEEPFTEKEKKLIEQTLQRVHINVNSYL